MEWLINLTTKSRQPYCPLMQVNKKAEWPSNFYSKGVTCVGVIKTLLRKECLSPFGVLKVTSSARPDVNKKRANKNEAKNPFNMKGSLVFEGLVFDRRGFAPDNILRGVGILRGNVALKHSLDRRKGRAPQLDHREKILPLNKRSQGHYLKTNSTTGTYNTSFKSPDQTELRTIISATFNGEKWKKIQLKVELKNSLTSTNYDKKG